jgi:hypothetical protein
MVGDVAGAGVGVVGDLVSKLGPRIRTGDGDDNNWSFWCYIKSWFNWCTQKGAPKAYSDPFNPNAVIPGGGLPKNEVKNMEDNLEKQMEKALDAGKAFDKGMEEGIEQIHPHSALKWWRYRYEYSYIEDLILIIILGLTGLWDTMFHQPMQSVVQVYLAPKENAWRDAGTSNKLYKKWLNHWFGTTTSLTLTGLTLWG